MKLLSFNLPIIPKHQLGEFLNTNPQILFSSNPQIGTQAMRFLSRALAGYNLLTAPTDRDKAWSAIHLIVSPEPTTPAILFAAQLADTLATLQHQKDLAERYAAITEIRAHTVRILKAVYIHEFNEEHRLLSDFDAALISAEASTEKLRNEDLYAFFAGPRSKETNYEISVRDIEEAIRGLASLLVEMELADSRIRLRFDSEEEISFEPVRPNEETSEDLSSAGLAVGLEAGSFAALQTGIILNSGFLEKIDLAYQRINELQKQMGEDFEQIEQAHLNVRDKSVTVYLKIKNSDSQTQNNNLHSFPPDKASSAAHISLE